VNSREVQLFLMNFDLTIDVFFESLINFTENQSTATKEVQ